MSTQYLALVQSNFPTFLRIINHARMQWQPAVPTAVQTNFTPLDALRAVKCVVDFLRC